jgi:hypothetical protein
MPNYPNAAGTSTLPAIPPLSLFPGDLAVAFSAEQPAVPQASVEFALASKDQNYPQSLSVELQFSGAPGAFSASLQTADTDGDIFYQNEGAVISAVSANNIARAEFSSIKAKFARVMLTTRTNAVTLTARISR